MAEDCLISCLMDIGLIYRSTLLDMLDTFRVVLFLFLITFRIFCIGVEQGLWVGVFFELGWSAFKFGTLDFLFFFIESIVNWSSRYLIEELFRSKLTPESSLFKIRAPETVILLGLFTEGISEFLLTLLELLAEFIYELLGVIFLTVIYFLLNLSSLRLDLEVTTLVLTRFS